MNLNSKDPSERSEAVESLINEELSEEVARTLCRMVEDTDNGVRNSVDLVLSVNQSPYIPINLEFHLDHFGISFSYDMPIYFFR